MTLHHKAYLFDFPAFENELLPLLTRAIEADNASRLRAFVEESRDSLSSPYDGTPLTPDWEHLLEAGDVQELADFALTKFYSVNADRGVGETWIDLSESLSESPQRALLGRALDGFDPGRQGSYFQHPADVAGSIAALSGCSHPALSSYVSLLQSANERGLGVYITF